MSFKRLTEQELDFLERAGVSLGQIMVIDYIREAHAEIDRLNAQALAESAPADEVCEWCGGTKWLHSQLCHACHGTGRNPKEKSHE